jgi:hypothetical protein
MSAALPVAQGRPSLFPSEFRRLFRDDMTFFAFCFAAQGLEFTRRTCSLTVPAIRKRLVFDEKGQLKKLQEIVYQPDGRVAVYAKIGEA